MKVAIPAHFITEGRVGGAEQALYNLVRGLIELGAELELLTARIDRISPAFLSSIGAYPNGSLVETGYFDNRFLAEQTTALLRKKPSDLYICPNYFTPFVLSKRCGVVSTIVHDLRFRRFPEFTSPTKRYWQDAAIRRTLRRADKVIAISNATAGDLRKYYGESAARNVVVIPNAVTWTETNSTDRRHPLDGNAYVLSVAHNWAHKNLATLMCAFAAIRHEFESLRLVLVGQMFDDMPLKHERNVTDLGELARKTGLEGRIVFTGYISDSELENYYRHAQAFAFPSLFEGFGLPVIEALGHGVPTVVAGIEPMIETSRGFAAYVDAPADVDAWAALLRDVLHDPDAYRPSEAQVTEIKETYAPKRVAAAFLDLVT